MSNPKTLSSQVIAENQYTTFIEDQYELENGSQRQFLLVERALGLMILPLVEVAGEWHTYLVEQHRYPINQRVWQVPMGSLEEDKDPLEQAKAELKQETGLVAERFTKISEFFVDPGLSRQRCVAYVAEGIADTGEQDLDESEGDMHVKQVPVAQLPAMLQHGELVDSWGFVAVYLVMQYLSTRQ